MEEETEERKPFEDDTPLDQDDQDVPDEIMEFGGPDSNVWLVKVPKFLMERWRNVPANIHLATMRVYNEKGPAGKTRISLFLPGSPKLGDDPIKAPYDTNGLAQEYELDIVKQEVDNQVVISERNIGPLGGRARATRLLGNIQHECNIRPLFTDTYRQTINDRSTAANTPTRQIKRLTKEDMPGGQAALNRLASGIASTTTLDKMIKNQRKTGKEFERFTRLPRNQVLDLIFQLFEEKSSWSFRDIRARTEQPAEYLKEILAEVAMPHRSGELNGQYTLLNTFKGNENRVKGEVPPPVSPGAVAMDASDEDEDEDEDMEEIQ